MDGQRHFLFDSMSTSKRMKILTQKFLGGNNVQKRADCSIRYASVCYTKVKNAVQCLYLSTASEFTASFPHYSFRGERQAR